MGGVLRATTSKGFGGFVLFVGRVLAGFISVSPLVLSTFGQASEKSVNNPSLPEPEIVDFLGPDGPSPPRNPPEKLGVLRPPPSPVGFGSGRSRLDTQDGRFPGPGGGFSIDFLFDAAASQNWRL